MRLHIHDSLIPSLRGRTEEDLFFSLLAGFDQAYDKSEASRLNQRPALAEHLALPKMIGCPKVALPLEEDFLVDTGLEEALARRESRLDFSGEPMSLDALSRLLRLSVGVTGAKHSGKLRRAYPSGGALYPVRAHLIATRIAGLDDGVYCHASEEHCLYRLSERRLNLSDLLYDQAIAYAGTSAAPDANYLSNACAAIVLTGHMEKAYAKYGDRAWRLAVLEAGHVAQNFYLAAAALGLKINAMGGWQTGNLVAELGLRRSNELPLHLMLVGR
jgi:SagB-type dehydrogenase family enzyme